MKWIPDVPQDIEDQIERENLMTQKALWDATPEAKHTSQTQLWDDEDLENYVVKKFCLFTICFTVSLSSRYRERSLSTVILAFEIVRQGTVGNGE